MELSTLNEEELLFDKLEKAAGEYYDENGCEDKREALQQILQNNDFRGMIEKSVCEDSLSTYAFTYAGAWNHTDILQLFIDHGMNIDIKNQFGDTALINASLNGRE